MAFNVISGKIVFVLGLANILGIFLVFFSCRCLVGAGMFSRLMENRWYRGFYSKHCLFWWIFLLSVAAHAILSFYVFGFPF